MQTYFCGGNFIVIFKRLFYYMITAAIETYDYRQLYSLWLKVVCYIIKNNL